jgi:hypothetical protein
MHGVHFFLSLTHLLQAKQASLLIYTHLFFFFFSVTKTVVMYNITTTFLPRIC